MKSSIFCHDFPDRLQCQHLDMCKRFQTCGVFLLFPFSSCLEMKSEESAVDSKELQLERTVLFVRAYLGETLLYAFAIII